MVKTLFVCEKPEMIARIYTNEQINDAPVIANQQLYSGDYRETAYLFSTWGAPRLTEQEIKTYLPKLEAVFYGAGSVQYFARPYLNCGVRVFSAWAANAVPVAEYTLAQILLANKGYFQLDRRYREGGFAAAGAYADRFTGNYGAKVGLLGAGMVGRKLISLLKPFEIETFVFDPFLSSDDAAALGVKKASLEEIFASCQVISNHLANNEQTKGILHYGLFSSMLPHAVFINTGRGAQVVEADLLRAMKEQPDRTALLDVTDPHEPLPEDHPFWDCPNILVTPHRAGSVVKETLRMGKTIYEQYCRLIAGEQPEYEVTLQMLETMA